MQGIDLESAVSNVSTNQDTDLFLYSGIIDRDYVNLFVDVVYKQVSKKERKNVSLFLCTNGGDPDAAYKMAKCLQRHYDNFTLFVTGNCKSAGTLIALGANQIVMSPHGELGPLDVQMAKRDELVFQSSGLDILQAFDHLYLYSQDIFDRYFMSLIAKSGGLITIKTAADIASSLTSGFMSPMLAQIDPAKLGEIKRAVRIARDYGVKLNADEDVVAKLINEYPSHSFVIDIDEAREIFPHVRELNEEEELMKEMLSTTLERKFGAKCLQDPADEIIILNLNELSRTPNNKENKYENKRTTFIGDTERQDNESTNIEPESNRNSRNASKRTTTEINQA